MENKSASEIVGNPNTPYLDGFSSDGVAPSPTTAKAGLVGPSLPDYLQVAAGSSCGSTSDAVVAGDAASGLRARRPCGTN